VFHSDWSTLESLVGEGDCLILIPVAIIGSAEGKLEEQTTRRQTTVTFDVKSELFISGRCAIHVQPKSMVVCVVLSIGKDKA
jgi:hypothetical protein